MPQLDGVLETSLYVNDLECSIQFYGKIFGFEIIDAGERLYALGVPGRQILLLFKKEASANLALGATMGMASCIWHLRFRKLNW